MTYYTNSISQINRLATLLSSANYLSHVAVRMTSQASSISPHSLLKLFTGFISAALMDWKLIVNKATIMAIDPARTKIHQ